MPSIRATGADARFIAAFEAAYGVDPAANYHQLLCSSFDPGRQPQLGYETELGQGDEDTDPFYEGARFRPTFGVHMGIDSFGFWLKTLMGAPVTTGSGPFTHTFGSTGDPPSFAFEEGDVGLASAIYWLMLGTVMGGMSIDLSPKGVAKANFTAFAKTRSKGGATAEGSPTAYSTSGVYKYFNKNSKVQWNGADVGQAMSGSLNYTTGAEEVETMRGDGQIEGVDDGSHGATGQLRIRRSAASGMYDDAVAETPRALKLIWTTAVNAAYKLELTFPKAYLDISGGGLPGPGGIDDLYNFRAAKASGGRVMTAVLINGVAGSVYA